MQLSKTQINHQQTDDQLVKNMSSEHKINNIEQQINGLPKNELLNDFREVKLGQEKQKIRQQINEIQTKKKQQLIKPNYLHDNKSTPKITDEKSIKNEQNKEYFEYNSQYDKNIVIDREGRVYRHLTEQVLRRCEQIQSKNMERNDRHVGQYLAQILQHMLQRDEQYLLRIKELKDDSKRIQTRRWDKLEIYAQIYNQKYQQQKEDQQLHEQKESQSVHKHCYSYNQHNNSPIKQSQQIQSSSTYIQVNYQTSQAIEDKQSIRAQTQSKEISYKNNQQLFYNQSATICQFIKNNNQNYHQNQYHSIKGVKQYQQDEQYQNQHQYQDYNQYSQQTNNNNNSNNSNNNNALYEFNQHLQTLNNYLQSNQQLLTQSIQQKGKQNKVLTNVYLRMFIAVNKYCDQFSLNNDTLYCAHHLFYLFMQSHKQIIYLPINNLLKQQQSHKHQHQYQHQYQHKHQHQYQHKHQHQYQHEYYKQFSCEVLEYVLISSIFISAKYHQIYYPSITEIIDQINPSLNHNVLKYIQNKMQTQLILSNNFIAFDLQYKWINIVRYMLGWVDEDDQQQLVDKQSEIQVINKSQSHYQQSPQSLQYNIKYNIQICKFILQSGMTNINLYQYAISKKVGTAITIYLIHWHNMPQNHQTIQLIWSITKLQPTTYKIIQHQYFLTLKYLQHNNYNHIQNKYFQKQHNLFHQCQ